jgi:hypothetical protein
MSIDMTLRLAILSVIAALLILGIAMDQDSYRAPRPPKSPVTGPTQ